MLLGQTDSNWKDCCPSLVSFVGQTGAGKSTLVKLLIHLNAPRNSEMTFSTPIAGLPGQDLPTSADIHLYVDPKTASSLDPILLADCEGLDGGERVPLAAAFSRSRDSLAIGNRRPSHDSGTYVERGISWADSSTKRTREFAVTHLYPRILFAFSNVMVFVHKNPRSGAFGLYLYCN
jgi:hypothetical protein